jgi:hypothetical protein
LLKPIPVSNTLVIQVQTGRTPATSANEVEIKFRTVDEAEMERLYQAALNDDIAWSRELRRIYGRRAGDARYDDRGVSTPELRELRTQKVESDKIWLAALRATREPLHARQALTA